MALLQAAQHYHQSLRWHIRIMLIMPDHLHAIACFPRQESIVAVWRDWKRYTAKTTGVVWQRDIFEHRLRGGESWEEKAAYIRANPVRRRLTANADEWPWVFTS